MYELGYCSFLLLLCKRKLTIFSKDKNSNSSVLAEYGGGYIQTILFCLFGFIQHYKDKGLSNGAVKEKINRQRREFFISEKIVIVSRHLAVGKCF